MITEQQINNIHKLNSADLCTIMQECVEALGVVSARDYADIMCQNIRTVYQAIADGKIKCIEICGTKYPIINAENG